MQADLMLAFNQLTVRDLAFDEAAQLTRAAGFDGIGVLLATVDELGVDRVRAVLRGQDLVPTSVCVAMGLTHPDEWARRRLVGRAVAALEMATDLDAPLVVVVGGPRHGLTLDAALGQVSTGLWCLADRGASIGGRILVEPLHPFLVGTSALSGLRQTLDMTAGLPASAVVVDTWHLWSEPGLFDAIRAGIDTIGLVHLADWAAADPPRLDREFPGDGIADLAGLCRHLIATGYTNWWEVEVLSEQLWRRDQRDLPARCAAAARRVLAEALPVSAVADELSAVAPR